MVTIHTLPRSCWPFTHVFSGRYNAALLADLHRYISPRDLIWKAEVQQWWFKESQLEAVTTLLRIHGGYQWVEQSIEEG